MGNTTTGAVNGSLYFIGVFSILLFFAIVFVMVYFAVRYRKSRNPVATEIHGAPWLEVLWVVLPTLLALAMFFYGLTGYNFLRHPPAGALEIQVHSKQWSWAFEYPDGRVVPNLVLPSGRDVRFTLSSDDVLHGFYIPDYRVQVDTVPGMKTMAWLKAGALGESDILCTVYCGTAHSNMMAKLIVLSPSGYEDWYAGKNVDLGLASPAAVSLVGSVLEKGSCLACHSTDGSSSMGPSFKGLYGQDVEFVQDGRLQKTKADEAYLRLAISEPGAQVVKGFDDAMPPSSLSGEELEALVTWFKEGLEDQGH